MSRDYYEVLGVSRDASEDEIKKAFRHLARENHPDRHQGDKAAEERFKEINEAYSVLSDPEKKRQYDAYGSAEGPQGFSGFGGQGGGADFGFGGLGDIFDAFFGGGMRDQTGPARGQDLQMEIALTLEECFTGVERDVRLTRVVTCQRCGGDGAEPGTSSSTCPRCHGAGQVQTRRQTAFGQFVTAQPCPECRGTGRHIPHPCTECRGAGRTRVTQTITARIPPGVAEGSRVRLVGEGEAGARGGGPGDLYLVVRERPHALFVRHGEDLHFNLTVSYPEAALGVAVEVQGIDGAVSLNVPAGTQPEQEVRSRGKGMPHVRGRGRGDLVAHVKVEVPKALSARERQLLEELQRVEGGQGKRAGKGFFRRVKDAL